MEWLLRLMRRMRLECPLSFSCTETRTREQGREWVKQRQGGATATVCSLPQAGIIYYSQEKYFHHVQQAAARGLEKFSNDPVLQFFKAYGVFREGKDQSVLAS